MGIAVRVAHKLKVFGNVLVQEKSRGFVKGMSGGVVRETRIGVVVCNGMQKVRAGIDDLNGGHPITQ
jgi:hypothetical protein